jgi:hypothetical protein
VKWWWRIFLWNIDTQSKYCITRRNESDHRFNTNRSSVEATEVVEDAVVLQWWEGKYVTFQFLAAASVKMTAFCNIALYSLVDVDRLFRDEYCLHHLITLLMEVAHTSQTSVYLYETTWRHIPGRRNIRKVCTQCLLLEIFGLQWKRPHVEQQTWNIQLKHRHKLGVVSSKKVECYKLHKYSRRMPKMQLYTTRV